MEPDEVSFRLIRKDDVPASNPLNLAYDFGLQDKEQNIFGGAPGPGGVLAFDFTLKAKKGPDPDHPIFTGRFASGPADDRFVYLSWRSVARGDYINRVKARLSTVDWKLVRASQKRGRPITADMTGWAPGDPRKHVPWSLG